MAIRRYEVQTTMNPVILNVLAVQSTLIGKILSKLVVNVAHAHFPAFF